MGQYYKAITKSNNRIKVYSRNVIIDGVPEYTFAKLTEHSWWGNYAVEAVCKDIYQRQAHTQLIWMGDYATTFLSYFGLKEFNGLNQAQIRKLFQRTWKEKGDDVEIPAFSLAGKYIVNHTKGVYIDCDAYYKRCAMKSDGDVWCMHPLPILTCIGNGLGGGDYYCPTDDSTFDEVGAWAWDEISIEDTAPKDYAEAEITFKERGWEEVEDTSDSNAQDAINALLYSKDNLGANV